MQRLKRFVFLSIFAIMVVVIGFFGVLPVGIAYLYVDNLVARECGNLPAPLSQDLPNAEPITFEPEPGMELEGWIAAGTNDAAIIILPGGWGGSNTMRSEMRFLNEAGYTVMTYDTRTCANPPHNTTLGYAEIVDLQAALDLLLLRPEIDPAKIGVYGHSMGGATAIMAAAGDQRIKAVAVSGNYADIAHDIRRNSNQQGIVERWLRGWIERFYEQRTGVNIEDVRPIAVIDQISPRPVLLIHGSEELHNSRGMEQFAAAQEPKELWIVQGAGHGGYAAVAPEEYPRRIIDFFDRYLVEAHD